MTKQDIQKIILQNRESLTKYKVQSIALFGSYVRNEQEEDSDIDFLVDFEKGTTLFDIVDLQHFLSELIGKNVQIVSRRGLNKYLEPYILKEAEIIGKEL